MPRFRTVFESKRARAGSLAIADKPQVARTCASSVRMSCVCLSLALHVYCFCFVFVFFCFLFLSKLRPFVQSVLCSSICTQLLYCTVLYCPVLYPTTVLCPLLCFSFFVFVFFLGGVAFSEYFVFIAFSYFVWRVLCTLYIVRFPSVWCFF